MKRPTIYKLFIRSGLLTLGMWAIWWGLNSLLNGDVWQGMVVSKSALTTEYCEFNDVTRLFHQRMNTYSNLVYFFFGVLILQLAMEDHKRQGLAPQNRLETFPLLSALMGICFVYLSFGSAFFHASLTYVGQRVDMNGTYGLTLALVSIALYHVLYKINLTASAKRIWVGVLVMLIILFLKVALLIPSSTLLPALIFALLLFTAVHYVQFRKERSGLVAIASLLLMVLAVYVRTMDVQKVGCNPYAYYQGHALWHVLTALSSLCSYCFFRFGGLKLNPSVSHE